MNKNIPHNNFKQEAEQYVDFLNNWENYCCACDFMDTDECPYLGLVENLTNWKLLGCKKFYD